MPAATIHFYFDYVSPYAYLASARLGSVLGSAANLLIPTPVLFAALLEHWGQKGPAEVAPKRLFVFKDAARKAQRWKIPLALPAFHPFNPLLALRATAAVHEPQAQLAAARCLFESAWARSEHLEDPAVVAAALERAGLTAGPLMDAARSDGVKSLLRDHTRAAVRRGVFGVPSFAVGDELLWGCDVLDDVLGCVEGRDPLPADMFRKLTLLRPSAERPASRPITAPKS